jgi:hypothetical protein
LISPSGRRDRGSGPSTGPRRRMLPPDAGAADGRAAHRGRPS